MTDRKTKINSLDCLKDSIKICFPKVIFLNLHLTCKKTFKYHEWQKIKTVPSGNRVPSEVISSGKSLVYIRNSDKLSITPEATL